MGKLPGGDAHPRPRIAIRAGRGNTKSTRRARTRPEMARVPVRLARLGLRAGPDLPTAHASWARPQVGDVGARARRAEPWGGATRGRGNGGWIRGGAEPGRALGRRGRIREARAAAAGIAGPESGAERGTWIAGRSAGLGLPGRVGGRSVAGGAAVKTKAAPPGPASPGLRAAEVSEARTQGARPGVPTAHRAPAGASLAPGILTRACTTVPTSISYPAPHPFPPSTPTRGAGLSPTPSRGWRGARRVAAR